MYLCKLILNPSHTQCRRDLADPYEMHRSLVRAVVRGETDTPPRLLWRQEGTSGERAVLLVQSPVEPVWDRAFTPGALLDQEQRQFDPSQVAHSRQRFRFRLVANPTVTRQGKRYGLEREEEQLAWLARQGECNGFMVVGCVRSSSSRLATRQRKGGGHRMVVQAAGFEGVLEVCNASALSQALSSGLGHAKALGLGLLSLAPAE